MFDNLSININFALNDFALTVRRGPAYPFYPRLDRSSLPWTPLSPSASTTLEASYPPQKRTDGDETQDATLHDARRTFLAHARRRSTQVDVPRRHSTSLGDIRRPSATFDVPRRHSTSLGDIRRPSATLPPSTSLDVPRRPSTSLHEPRRCSVPRQHYHLALHWPLRLSFPLRLSLAVVTSVRGWPPPWSLSPFVVILLLRRRALPPTSRPSSDVAPFLRRRALPVFLCRPGKSPPSILSHPLCSAPCLVPARSTHCLGSESLFFHMTAALLFLVCAE
jgi:hypothetical protein